MPYEKVKNESGFEGFGGINTKVSNYITGLHECLDLQNFDFSRPGAWSTRWGSTQYLGNTLTGRILGVNEFERLDGYSVTIVSTNNRVFYEIGGISFQQMFIGTAATAAPVNPSFDGNLFEYRAFVNSLFFSNGSSGSFLKFTGQTLQYGSGYSLLVGSNYSYLYNLPDGPSASQMNATFSGVGFVSITGIIKVGIGWLDVLGYRSAPGNVNFSGFSFSGGSPNGIGVTLSSSLIPWDYGVTAISIYGSNPNGSQLFLFQDIPLTNTSINNLIAPWGGRASLSVNANFFVEFAPSSNGFDVSSIGYRDPAQYPLFFTLSPKYLEIYNNQVYMAGFTAYIFKDAFGATQTANYQSRLFWSDVGNSEFVDPTFFAEVRTNDSDRITCLKNYQTNMMIFKQRSFHTLFANSSTDISIQENSDQYGCLSNRCAITYNQQLLFLDRKGIIRWDGANISVASDKIEPIFARMNISAAIDNAVGIHFKKRNEVWFGIPVDGATLNNLTIVYDYIADSWTTFNGFVPSYFTIAKGALSDYTCLYGSYSGAVFNFGSSLPSDNGTAITAIATSLFYRDMGNTVEKQWRRLFVDANIMSSGSTLQIDLVPDHGTSIYATRYMAMGTFQNRIDFGIPAKSLQFKFTYASATLPININGITPESRYQRSV